MIKSSRPHKEKKGTPTPDAPLPGCALPLNSPPVAQKPTKVVASPDHPSSSQSPNPAFLSAIQNPRRPVSAVMLKSRTLFAKLLFRTGLTSPAILTTTLKRPRRPQIKPSNVCNLHANSNAQHPKHGPWISIKHGPKHLIQRHVPKPSRQPAKTHTHTRTHAHISLGLSPKSSPNGQSPPGIRCKCSRSRKLPFAVSEPAQL